MKGKRYIHIICAVMATNSAFAQYVDVTYSHDDSKMNQITVGEIGSGSLTPELYYNTLHSNYSKTAATKNKLSFRTTAGIAAYQQVDDAEALDSAFVKRAEVEALNIADRQIDLAWAVEGAKLDSKMADFKSNINRIRSIGGTTDEKSYWEEYYNVYNSAITATKNAYMPNSQRKQQYLQIYADVAKKNETLLNYLVTLSNRKSTIAMLNATYTKPDARQAAVASAKSHWQEAGLKTR